MGHRINERNIGSYTINGSQKIRRNAIGKLSEEEKQLAKNVIMKVYECMESEDDMYRDGGRFLLQLTKEQWQSLFDIQEKL